MSILNVKKCQQDSQSKCQQDSKCRSFSMSKCQQDSQSQNVNKIPNVKMSTRFSVSKHQQDLKVKVSTRFPMSKWQQDSQHLSVNIILHPGCPQTFHTKIHTLSRPFLVKIQKANLIDSSPTGLLIHHLLCFTVRIPKHCPLMITINIPTTAKVRGCLASSPQSQGISGLWV